MTTLYPLRFEPLLKRYLWGGRRLGSVLNKQIGEGNDYAESWEVADRGRDQTIVSAGPLKWKTLGEVVAEHGQDLFGIHAPQVRFPLIFKFLDCRDVLSVQVHPDDTAAAKLDPPDLGKTEAWLILHAEPGSYVYAGLKRGFDRAALEREIARGTIELCLNRLEPKAGDCLFIPAGMIHALGPGLLVAEIQQASDTTFRLFDWNRLGPDGTPRPLHIEQGLAATKFQLGPAALQKPQTTERPFVERLVACDKFVLDRWQIEQPQTIGGDQRLHIISVLHGSVNVAGDAMGEPLRLGQTMVLPASLPPVPLAPNPKVQLLDIYLP